MKLSELPEWFINAEFSAELMAENYQGLDKIAEIITNEDNEFIASYEEGNSVGEEKYLVQGAKGSITQFARDLYRIHRRVLWIYVRYDGKFHKPSYRVNVNFD